MKKRNEKKTRMKMRREHEITLIVSGSLAIAILALLLLNFNFPIAPAENYESDSTIIVFRWLGFANKVFVDDNPDFISAKVIDAVPGKKYTITELEPGNYYWKTDGISIIHEFTIEHHVAIEIENSSVVNKGNVPVLLEFFRKIGITGYAVLDVNQEMNIDEYNESSENETEKVVASQHD